jgi:hypothetical protein
MASSTFNLAKPGAALLGMWEEERILKQDGLAVRVVGKGAVDSFERCMPRCRASKSAAAWASTQRVTQASVLQPSQAPSAPPRGAAAAAAIAAEAAALVAAGAAAAAAALVPRGANASEARSAFHGAVYDVDAYGVAQGVAAARASRGGAASPAPSVAQQAAALGASARPGAYASGHYASDAPVTSFSARLPELVFPYAFSGAGQAAAGKEHAAALYGAAAAAAVPQHLLAPGAELSLAPLLTRFLRRLREAGVAGLQDFLERLGAAVGEGALARAADARAGGGSVLGQRMAAPNPHAGDARFVRADVFRLFVHSLRTRVSDLDLESIVRMASPQATARDQVPVVSLALLEQLESLAAAARG